MKPCLVCGRPTSPGPRCPVHEQVVRAAYHGDYRRRRAAVLGGPCTLQLPGCTSVATTADHVIPVSRGGRDGPLRGACAHCNTSRGDRDVRPTRGAGVSRGMGRAVSGTVALVPDPVHDRGRFS